MRTASRIAVRDAAPSDLAAIRSIYNQGIEDRIATLEQEPKTEEEIAHWFASHEKRYSILVAMEGDSVVGWASLNPYSHRCAYDGVADLSVYVRRDKRGEGVGSHLLREIEQAAAFTKSSFSLFQQMKRAERSISNRAFAM